MSIKTNQILGQTISTLLTILFLVTPALVLPWTSELFELPKMMLVYFITLLVGIVWLAHWPLTGRLPFRRTPLDVPILFFLLTQILATFFSIHPYTSVWGWYSRQQGGLASTAVCIILYYAFVTFFSPKSSPRYQDLKISNSKYQELTYLRRETRNPKLETLLRIILLSSIPIALYAIAQHWGIDEHLWVQDVKARVFSTLGQPNWLAAYLSIVLSFSFLPILNQSFKFASKIGRRGIKSPKFKVQSFNLNLKINNILNLKSTYSLLTIYYYLLPCLLYLALLYTRSRSGWFGFVAADVIFWGVALYLTRQSGLFKSFLRSFLILNFSFLILSFLSSTPFTPSAGELLGQIRQPDVETQSIASPQSPEITPSEDIRLLVWKGAWELGKKFPLLGTGPETFGYSYYWVRPVEHNLVSEWNFLYNKAHNEYLNFLAGSGFVGLGGYLFLIGSVVWQIIQQFKTQNSKLRVTTKNFNLLSLPSYFILSALVAAYTSILITNFFGFSVVVVGLYFWILPAMAMVMPGFSSPLTLRRSGPVTRFLISTLVWLLMVATGYGLVWVYDGLKADLEFRLTEKLLAADEPEEALDIVQRVAARRPHEVNYYDLMAEIYGNLAVIAHYNGNKLKADFYARQAVMTSDRTLNLNPYHLNILKNRASLFVALSSIDKTHNREAIDTLEYAAQLAPTDPKILYNLALLYAREEQVGQTIELLERSVSLKPDYVESLYALGLFTYELAVEENGMIKDKTELKKAIGYLERLLSVEPGNESAMELLAKWRGEDL
jgi:O-antigen ligase/cytochrome c-type biogenesis protein CcmH/NrfG